MKQTVFLFLIVVITSSANADYYLKFTASGASLPNGTKLVDSTASWIDVSIIDTHPNDGPIHYENSLIGSYTKFNRTYSPSINGYRGDHDNLYFYYEGVPKSVTIKNTNTGVKRVITAGNQPERFNNAPAFLLPDRLVVAPGLSVIKTGSSTTAVSGKIYVVASMPMRPVVGYSYDATIFDNNIAAHIRQTELNCVEGWTESHYKGAIAIWKVVETCQSFQMFAGDLSHVIKFE